MASEVKFAAFATFINDKCSFSEGGDSDGLEKNSDIKVIL